MKKRTHLELSAGSSVCGALVTSRYLTRITNNVDCSACKSKVLESSEWDDPRDSDYDKYEGRKNEEKA